MPTTDASAPTCHAAHACKFARERAGLTRAELGRRIGVSAQVVQRWESGRHALLESTIARVAAALGKRVFLEIR